MSEAKPTSQIDSKLEDRYADHLEFLWEQYNKLLGLGVIASALTLGFLLQVVLFNKDVREVIVKLKSPLNTNWLVVAISAAGCAAVLFLIARWCSQLLMERQIYGRRSDAVRYFQGTLDDETILPTALKDKPFMGWIDRILLLRIIGILNEVSILLGILCIAGSWLSGFIFAWPLIDSLAPPSN